MTPYMIRFFFVSLNLYSWAPSPLNTLGSVLVGTGLDGSRLQRETADAEIEVQSAENLELTTVLSF